MSDERLTDLEMKLTYQESTIEALSKVIYQQQKEIDLLKADLKQFKEQLQTMSTSGSSHRAEDEKPPPHF
jgi:SlyX protein